MTSSRAYLIRRDCRQFIGPMNGDELRRSLARMDFGLEDEISGHCGPWVILDRKEELTASYPQIAKLLGDSLPLSWRENTNHARVISRHRTKGDKGRSSPSGMESGDGLREFLASKRKKSRALTIFAISLVACAAIVAAGILWKRKDDVPPYADVLALSEKSDITEFLNVMGMRVVPSAPSLMKSIKNQSLWLPLFRMYAFNTTGSIDGISRKILRGDVPLAFNSDCTVEWWKRKWKDSSAQIEQFVAGQGLHKNPWTKIMSMDPYWIRRRPQKGWNKPANLYEGCLMTAIMAINSLTEEAKLPGAGGEIGSEEVFHIIKFRLQHQLDVVRKIPSISALDASANEVGALGMITCLDAQTTVAGLSNCKSVIRPEFDSFIGEHYVLVLIHIALSGGQKNVDGPWKSVATDALPAMAADDIMGHLSLLPEYKFVTLLLGGAEIEQAKLKVEQEFQDVKFE